MKPTTERSRAAALASDLLPIALIVVVVFLCLQHSMADADIWWHLRDAQVQLSSHTFLRHDSFSFTAEGSPWMDHEWLAEIPFYLAFKAYGWTGIYLLTLLVIETIFASLLFLSRTISGSIGLAASSTVLGILLSTVSFGPRTLLFGWLLLVIELWILELSDRHPQLIWSLPIVFAVWVNTHGSWLIGMVIFILFTIANCLSIHRGQISNSRLSSPRLVQLTLSLLVSGAALFLNPYGWRLVAYPFDLAFRQKLNIQNVEEWKSLDFHTPRGHLFVLTLALIFLSQLVRRRRWRLFDLALLGLGVNAALTYSRFLFLAAILVMPLLARSFAPAHATPRRLNPRLNFALLVLVLCCLAGNLRTSISSATIDDPRYPRAALSYLASLPPSDRIFNEFIWGGFLMWHLPHRQVFIDSRVDIFEYNGTFKDYLDITHLDHPEELLDKYRIQDVVFARQSPLITFLKANRSWKVVYEDRTTAVMRRIDAPQPEVKAAGPASVLNSTP